MNTHRLRASLVALFAMILAGGSIAAASTPARPVQTTGDAHGEWGYVVVRRAMAPTYAPAPKDQGNSTGGVNSVTWTETGHYEVTMPGLATESGAVLVSPLGDKPRRCVVEIWFTNATDEIIDVACFTRTGTPVNSQLVVTFLIGIGSNADSPPGFGYDWADQPDSSPSPYLPARKYNSVSGSSNPVSHPGPGSYIAAMNALGTPGGNVQLTAISNSAATCQASWQAVNVQMQIAVKCRTTGSALVNMQFDVILTDKAGLKGIGVGPVAYLMADRPTEHSYFASQARRYSSAHNAPRITRTSTGTYVVTLEGMPLGGAAVVTPLNGGAALCSIAGIRRQGLPQRIGVRCFGADGAPQDTKFSLSFLR
jgi:hypothetical protein